MNIKFAICVVACIQTWDAAFCEGDAGLHRQPDPTCDMAGVPGTTQHQGTHPGRSTPHTCRLPQYLSLQVGINLNIPIIFPWPSLGYRKWIHLLGALKVQKLDILGHAIQKLQQRGGRYKDWDLHYKIQMLV